ncbi:MAG: hypothetical protein AB7V00_05650 [Bacilli bacterium]
MKKILFILMLLFVVTISVGCGDENDNLPSISNPQSDYFTVVEGGLTYSTSRETIYNRLKNQVGLTTMLDMVDIDLLKATAKGDSNYWNAITEEQISDAIDEAVFTAGKEGLTDEEISEQLADHYNSLLLNSGLLDLSDIQDYYHLTLAKKLYVEDVVRARYEEEDFSDTDYETTYNNNYKTSNYAIIVTYPTQKTMEEALLQLGTEIVGGVWQNASTQTPLTNQEVVALLIALYNNQHSSEISTYPVDTLSLVDGEEYSSTTGTIEFALDKIDELNYTYAELNNYQVELINLFDKMGSYPEANFYTATPKIYKNGSRYLLAMKIAEEQPTFDSVKAEIREKLIKGAVTTTSIEAETINLRADNGFKIYDNLLETTYVTKVETAKLTFDTTKKTSDHIVCETSVKSYSADDLFEQMNRRYGINISISELDYLRLINSRSFNNIYDIKTSTVLDQTAWDVILQQVKDEKANFNNDVYADYGYPKSYGWTNFLQDIYSVNSEDELAQYYLYLEIRDRFTATLGDLSDDDETSPLWLFYQTQMQKVVDDYYKVKGVHLLIAKYEGSTMVNPQDWTENQTAMAEEFYRAIMNYLETETGTYIEKLQALELAFTKAPIFVAGKPQTTAGQDVIDGIDYTFKGMEISKYKTAGLTIMYQDLGTFANGTMVDEFSDAVRTLWKADPTSTTPTVYGLNPTLNGVWSYIISEFGYHVYVNLESYALTGWEVNKYIPTLEQIKLYIEDSTTDGLTLAQKTAITTYYTPINTELVGTNNVSAQSYRQMMAANINFQMATFTNADFLRQMTTKLETYEEQLKYR